FCEEAKDEEVQRLSDKEEEHSADEANETDEKSSQSLVLVDEDPRPPWAAAFEKQLTDSTAKLTFAQLCQFYALVTRAADSHHLPGVRSDELRALLEKFCSAAMVSVRATTA